MLSSILRDDFRNVFTHLIIFWNSLNQNSNREEIKSIMQSGNACYYSVHDLLSSSFLSKNIEIKIYKIIILPVVLYGCDSWLLTLREECRLRMTRLQASLYKNHDSIPSIDKRLFASPKHPD